MSHHLFQWLQSFTASNPAPIECCGINFLHLNIIGPFGEISCQIEEGLIVKFGGFKNSGLIVTTLPLTLFCWLILMQFNHTACCPRPQRFTNYPLIRAEVSSLLFTPGPSTDHGSKYPGPPGEVRPSSRQTWDLIIIRRGTAIGN